MKESQVGVHVYTRCDAYLNDTEVMGRDVSGSIGVAWEGGGGVMLALFRIIISRVFELYYELIDLIHS